MFISLRCIYRWSYLTLFIYLSICIYKSLLGGPRKEKKVILKWIGPQMNLQTYCHPQTDCFFVSQLFHVARHMRCFKLGLKTDWFYSSWISYPKGMVPLSKSEGILHIYLFTYTLIGYQSAPFMSRALYLCICSSQLFPIRVLNPRGGGAYIYILLSTDRMFHCITTRHIYIYIYIYLSLFISTFTYIYIERERENTWKTRNYLPRFPLKGSSRLFWINKLGPNDILLIKRLLERIKKLA